jgi:hypothetical protein
VSQQESLNAAERLPVSQRESSNAAERLPVSQQESLNAAERLPVSQRESSNAAERLPASHRESSDAAERLPVSQRESSDAAEPLPASHRESLNAAGRLRVSLCQHAKPHRETFHAVRRLPVPLFVETSSLRREAMGTTPKTPDHPIAVLKIPEDHVPHFIVFSRSVIRAMTGKSWFPSPVPPLTVVDAATDALDAAQTATLLGGIDTVAVRDEKRRDLVSLLEQLRAYVQSIADANPEQAMSIIESAGMFVKKKGFPPLRKWSAKPGPVSGSVILFAPKAGNRASYEWAYSLDGMKTWISLPITVKATTTVEGLPPGATVYFRYRATTKDGTTDWSDPISLIVD